MAERREEGGEREREREPLGPRWVAGPLLRRPGESGIELRVVKLLREGAAAPPPFTPAAAERVHQRLVATRRPRGRVLLMRPAAVFGLMLAGAGIAAASFALVQRFGRDPAPPAETPGRGSHTPATRAVPAAPVLVPAPAPAPAAAPGPAASTAPAPAAVAIAARPPSPARSPAARVRKPRRAPAQEVPVSVVGVPATTGEPSSGLAEETMLFRSALAKLRVDRDPAGAIELLDRYASTYPRGSYLAEATVARVDALLASGRSAQALAALRAHPTLDRLPRGLELLVTRAELAAAAGDCPAARGDFDRVLARTAASPLAERALYGRAVCHARDGQRAAAARSFEEYLRRFPQGRYAEQSAAALAR